MATVNFSGPDDVKEAFSETYKRQNKSAVIADPMREAVGRILERRKHVPEISEEEIRAAREEGRP